jgi:hypothetical protein
MIDDKIKLGVLWKNLSKEGKKPYLSGRVQEDSLEAAVQLLREGGRFLVLTNKKRPDKQDPDCEIFVVPERGRREERSESAPVAPRRTAPGGDEGGQRTRMGSPPRR